MGRTDPERFPPMPRRHDPRSHRRLRAALLLLVALLACGASAVAQPTDPVAVDPIVVDSLRADTTRITAGDSLVVRRTSGAGLDSVVSYTARDIYDDVKRRKLILVGDAEFHSGDRDLTAYYIEVDLATSILYARARYDSASGLYSGVPVFRQGSEEITANEITYNFRTRRATLAAAETQFEDGFYYGATINKVTDRTIFIEDGKYTTCDLRPTPHYWFASPEMKVVTGDKVFADQVALNVEGVPIFYIPFGVFFANRTGKQSGLILPSYGFEEGRGVYLQGLGFFWAGNDYVDASLSADIFSKGGYVLRNRTRLRVNDIRLTTSDLDLEFIRTRDDPDQELRNDYTLSYRHNQRIGRQTSLAGNLRFASQNAIRRSLPFVDAPDVTDRTTTQLVTSNLDLSTQIGPLSLSTSFQRTQNIVTDELTVATPISISLPTINPFASSGGEGLLDNLSIGYSGRGGIQWLRQDTLPGGGFRVRDRQMAFQHTPSLNFSLKLGDYLSFVPRVNYIERWYFRRQQVDVVGDTIETRQIDGFQRAWTATFGADLATKLYGIVQPRVFGINAIRHTIEPRIGFTWSPDYGDPSFGYYQSYVDPRTGEVVPYSIFEADRAIVSAPGRGRTAAVNMSLGNVFEAKVAAGDTLPDEKLTLLNLNLSSSYNFALDSFQLAPILASASTQLGRFGNLSGTATFDPYGSDSLGRRTKEFALDRGQGLVRVTSVALTMSTSFSSEGFTTGTVPAAETDSALGARGRFALHSEEFDSDEFFGENVRGAADFEIPWNLGLTANYTVTPNFNSLDTTRVTTSLNLSATLGFRLTPTTRIETGATYNFQLGEVLIPRITLAKDLHCWEMSLNWSPTIYAADQIYFRIGLKAPQLRDIQYEIR